MEIQSNSLLFTQLSVLQVSAGHCAVAGREVGQAEAFRVARGSPEEDATGE